LKVDSVFQCQTAVGTSIAATTAAKMPISADILAVRPRVHNAAIAITTTAARNSARTSIVAPATRPQRAAAPRAVGAASHRRDVHMNAATPSEYSASEFGTVPSTI